MYEMHAALASLGIVYAVCLDVGRQAPDVQDHEIEAIFNQLEEEYGQVNFEAWLGLLVCSLQSCSY